MDGFTFTIMLKFVLIILTEARRVEITGAQISITDRSHSTKAALTLRS